MLSNRTEDKRKVVCQRWKWIQKVLMAGMVFAEEGFGLEMFQESDVER